MKAILMGLLVLSVVGTVEAAPLATDSAPLRSTTLKAQPQILVSPDVSSSHIPQEASETPEISDTCGVKVTIVGTDTAGIVTVETPNPPDNWNLGCTITFAERFKTPACSVSMYGGSTTTGNRARIVAQKPESMHIQAFPNNFQGGEKVVYHCFEATP